MLLLSFYMLVNGEAHHNHMHRYHTHDVVRENFLPGLCQETQASWKSLTLSALSLLLPRRKESHGMSSLSL